MQFPAISDYNYTLPQSHIAQYPLEKRDTSKLLLYSKEKISDYIFSDVASVLPQNALLICNNTKVIHARLEFYKQTGARLEVFLLEPQSPQQYEYILQQKHTCSWYCIVGNAKKWKQEVLTKTISVQNKEIILTAQKEFQSHDSFCIRFTWTEDVRFCDILEAVGEIPIPPYLLRKSEDIDTERYQTVYASEKGSVAAPTAGLHFTDTVLSSLAKKGIRQGFVTLHVGAGTFKPVQTENYLEHSMHREFFTVSKELIQKLQTGSYCIAVGTTSVRTLESLYWLGVKIGVTPSFQTLDLGQWEPKHLPQNVPATIAFTNLLQYLDDTNADHIQAYTQIMIVPGYTFKVVSAMFTNFHQPKSTLLLLISAFVGDGWKKIYEHALVNNYRFLSYGDSSLLIP